MLIDDRGRLFGHVNAVDATAAACAVAAIALGVVAFGAVAPRRPVVTRISPSVLRADAPVRLRFVGHDLHPFLQALVAPHGQPPVGDPTRGEWIGVGDTTVAELRLPRLDAGEYDVHLYDRGREVAVCLSAFTIQPPSSVGR
jgi:uncharacterized protein DUF4330